MSLGLIGKKLGMTRLFDLLGLLTVLGVSLARPASSTD